MKVPRGGLLARTLAATLTGLLVVGALAAAVGAERAVDHARSARARELRLFAVATAARMQPLSSLQRARLAQRLSAATRLDAAVIARAHTPPRSAALGHTAVGGRARVEVAEPLDAREVLRVRAPADAPGGPLLGTLARVLAVLLAAGALGVAVSLAVARDIAAELRAVTAQADALRRASHAPGGPLPVHGGDEVGDVVAAFNQLRRVFDVELARHRDALAALEETERRRDAWLTTLRHELRTPLNAIKGFADLLQAEIDGPLTDAQREDVEAIASAGRHLLRLVDDVLDLSAIATGRFAVERVRCDLAAITRAAVSEAQGIARGRGVELSLDVDGPALLLGDAVALRRAVTNLVLNAVQHAGGRVRVRVTREVGELTVAVDDNGPGIAPGELRRLFRPFERGDTAEARGAGLGLAITVALVDLHGGTLSAHSEVGRGSTFTAHLPSPTEIA